MSTLWTPSGEHPVDKRSSGAQGAPGSGSPPPNNPSGPNRTGPPPRRPDSSISEEEAVGAEVDLEELSRQLADTPAETVIANHCYGLFELAALYLSHDPPLMAQSRAAIDALGYLVEGMGNRLGEAAGPLREALAQIRLGFVQVETALRARGGAPEGDDEW